MSNNKDMKIKLALDAANFKSGLKDAANAMKDFKSKVGVVANAVAQVGKAYVKLGTESVKWFGNALKTTVKTAAAIGTAIAGISAAAVNMAGEFQALDSMFSETFGSIADDATKAMDKIAKETGIVSGRLKAGFTDMFMQLKGSGIEANEALGLTEKGMRLAADAAAAYNIPLEDAVAKLRSFIRGNTEAGDSIGLFTSEAQRNEAAVEKYGKKWQELTEAQKQNLMLDISEKIYKESGAMGQAAREADNLENVIGNLKYSFKEFLANLGYGMLDGAISSIKEFGNALDETNKILKEQGLAAAVEHMVDFITKEMSDFASKIPEYMSTAIDGIVDFINTSLPKIFAAGGDIIKNIADGIVSNEQSISDGISSVIGQLATWITDNMPAIEAAGRTILNALKNGIENNKEEISGAVETVVNTAVDLFLGYKTLIYNAGLEFGWEFIKGVWQGIWDSGQNYKPTNDNYFVPTAEEATQQGLEYGTAWISSAGKVFDENGPSLLDSLTSNDSYTKIQVSGEESGYAYINGVKTKISELSPEVKTVVDDLLKNQEKATEEGKKTGKAHTDGAKAGIQEGKEDVKSASKQVSTESAAAMLDELSQLKPETYNKMLDAAQAVRQSATDMYNGAKYSFSQLGLAAKESMTDMYKGVGTSMYMLSQKVKQEASNMYNGAKTSFINLCNVGKNQFSNLYNGAGNSMRSLSHTVQGCMNTIKSAINSIGGAVNSAISDYNRLRSALSKPINAKVNIAKTTTVKTVSDVARASYNVASYGRSLSAGALSSGKSQDSTQNMTVNIMLDSKTIATQTAPYINGELNVISKRQNRLGGAF